MENITSGLFNIIEKICSSTIVEGIMGSKIMTAFMNSGFPIVILFVLLGVLIYINYQIEKDEEEEYKEYKKEQERKLKEIQERKEAFLNSLR